MRFSALMNYHRQLKASALLLILDEKGPERSSNSGPCVALIVIPGKRLHARGGEVPHLLLLETRGAPREGEHAYHTAKRSSRIGDERAGRNGPMCARHAAGALLELR